MHIKVKGKGDDKNRALLERIQNTLAQVYNGEISNLECPHCSSRPLRFSYTNWASNRYGVWISCTYCGKEAHIISDKRPPGYDEKYVLKEFQERDEMAAKEVDDEMKKRLDKLDRLE